MKPITLFIFLLLVAGNAFSQKPPNPVVELKKGVLVVRLRTKSNKIAQLKEQLLLVSQESKQHEWLVNELNETIREVEEENKYLVNAFEDLYRYSDVLYIPDTLAPLLHTENTSGIFVNASMQKDSQLILGNRFFMVAAIGVVPPSEGASSLEQLLIYDRDFNFMTKPFPGYYKPLPVAGTASPEVYSTTPPDRSYAEMDIRRSVEWFNNKFFKYSERQARRLQRKLMRMRKEVIN